MSKNYDLYPASERKIDNWRRRILGYEKMKRDLQRQIQILKNKNKRQKEVISKTINAIDLVIELIKQQPTKDDRWILDRLNGFKIILEDKEVSE